MDHIQLYINGQLADVSDDTPVALTFQINNLAEVKNQQGNTSNQFKLPLTQRNRAILGIPDEIAFTNQLPNSQYEVRIIQDGMEVIPVGIGELNSIEQDNANFTVLSGNVDFFDNIDGKLYDMGDSTSQWSNYGKNLIWKPYEHDWTMNNVVNSQNKTEGWIWPVIDYGKLATDYSSTPPKIDVRYLRPGFFLHTAINLLVASAGYTAQGSLLNDSLYKKLIVQFANDEFMHSTDYQGSDNDLSVSVSNQAIQTLTYPGAENRQGTGRIKFADQTTPPSGKFRFDSNDFIAPLNMDATVSFSFTLQTYSSRKKHDIYVKFFIRSNMPDNKTVVDFFSSDNYDNQSTYNSWVPCGSKTISKDVSLVTGQSILIAYSLSDVYAQAQISGATLTITCKGNVVYTQKVQCERIFPDISQKDLLKDTLQHFGIICQSDNTNRTVNFASLKDIISNIPIAKNWTQKCIDQGKTISFQLGGYAQINYMKYKDDDNVLPAGLANSQINVNDATLAASADLFESQFAPTINRPWIGDSIAKIGKIDPTSAGDDFTISTQPRLLIDQKMQLPAGKSIIFTDGGTASQDVIFNDTLSVPYFDKPGAADSLHYDKLRIKYYPELERILKYSKKMVRYFLLNPRDILELDLLIPVYLEQDNAYFYINKIDSWRKGQPTKVELILLG